MADPGYLGEFEQLVLLAVLQADQMDAGAYGTTVFDELVARTERRIARGAVYMTLDRLEKKGLLESFESAPTPQRGGRTKRCYSVTKRGMAALQASRRALVQLWKDLDAFGPIR
ncbi:MAG: helix-turn-helix transcriptional regulator [Vicinamibacterales bacterium]|jgi:DNA-binding PadR family transcriptional regulator